MNNIQIETEKINFQVQIWEIVIEKVELKKIKAIK